MGELKVWNYNNSEVRTVNINNEPWWVLTDVCKVLELSNATKVAQRLEEDERSNFKLGRQGEATIINESGLYSVILRSDKPQAKPFRKWVTSEVLPSIRKTGMYATDELLNNPDLAIKAFTALKEEREKNKLLTEENKTLEAENTKKENIIQENQPKVDFAEGVTKSKGTISMSQFAKMVSKETGKTIGRNAILLWLRQQKILMRTNEPYQMYKKYFEYIPVLNHWGKGGFATRVTGRGQVWLFERLKKAGVIGEKKNTKLVSVGATQEKEDLSWVDEI